MQAQKRVAKAVEVLVDGLAEMLVERASRAMKNGHRKGTRLDMACRVPGCKRRSRGPRFLYMCIEHTKLPKAKQRTHLRQYHAKGA